MKVLTTTGLTKLIELSKNTFLDKDNVIDVSDALATVAVTGSYNDLSNKPTVDQTYNSTSTNAQSGTAVTGAISGKQDTLVSGTNIKTINNVSILGSGNLAVSGLPSQSGQSGKFLSTNGTTASWTSVAPVATSGSYSDLTNKLTAGTDINISASNVVSCTHPEVYLTQSEYDNMKATGTLDPNTYYNTSTSVPFNAESFITIKSSMNPGDTLTKGYMVLVEVQ